MKHKKGYNFWLPLIIWNENPTLIMKSIHIVWSNLCLISPAIYNENLEHTYMYKYLSPVHKSLQTKYTWYLFALFGTFSRNRANYTLGVRPCYSRWHYFKIQIPRDTELWNVFCQYITLLCNYICTQLFHTSIIPYWHSLYCNF